MTQFKVIVVSIMIGIIAILYTRVSIQNNRIAGLESKIDSLKMEMQLESIGSHADGEIDAMIDEYDRRRDENSSGNTFDFDWLF